MPISKIIKKLKIMKFRHFLTMAIAIIFAGITLASCKKDKDDNDFSLSGKTYYATETVAATKNVDAQKTIYYIFEFTDGTNVKYYEKEGSLQGTTKNNDNGTYSLNYPSININLSTGAITGTFSNENTLSIGGKTYTKN